MTSEECNQYIVWHCIKLPHWNSTINGSGWKSDKNMLNFWHWLLSILVQSNLISSPMCVKPNLPTVVKVKKITTGARGLTAIVHMKWGRIIWSGCAGNELTKFSKWVGRIHPCVDGYLCLLCLLIKKSSKFVAIGSALPPNCNQCLLLHLNSYDWPCESTSNKH